MARLGRGRHSGGFSFRGKAAASTTITPVAAYIVNSAGSDQTTLVTTSFTPADGEIIVVKAQSQRGDGNPFPTPTGGSLTYTLRESDSSVSHDRVALWTAAVGTSPGSMTVSLGSPGATNNHHSMVVERWQNAQLAGTPASVLTTGTASVPSTTLSTVAAGSVVSWLNSDFNAVDGASRVYNTTSATPQETGYRFNSGSATFYWAWQSAAASGSQTFGLTAPSGQNWSLIGIEIQTAASVTDAAAITATVTVDGQDAQIQVAPLADIPIGTTAQAQDATVATAVSAAAITATVIADGSNTTTTISTNISEAQATGTAQDATVVIGTFVAAQPATATADAQTATTTIALRAIEATASSVAEQPTIVTGTQALAQTATATGDAQNTSTTIAPGSPTATGTGIADTLQATIAPTPQGATAAGDGQGATIRIAPVVDIALGPGQAQDALVSIGGSTFANAETAIGSGAAQQSSATISPELQTAVAVGTVQNASARIAPLADVAIATGEAIDVTTVEIRIYGLYFIGEYLSYECIPVYVQGFSSIVHSDQFTVVAELEV